MASGSDSNSVVSQALNGQKILRKASLSLSLIYNKIQTCIRCEKDLKKGEVLNGKFVFLKYIGRGSFGKVIKAKNIQTDEIVAIKMTENISPLQRHALQEIKTLTEIHTFDSNNGFIVKMLEYFNWKDSICIVFEILHQTLYQLLKETDFQGIHLSHVKVLAWQIIMALKFLSVPQLGIIHCDLKPENIMIASKQRAGVKIIDFGSSCKKIRKYRYVQSRYYRAPEVLLGLSYSSPIDMWSAGCVFAELLVGKPIFPGTTESNQLLHITEFLGPYEIPAVSNAKSLRSFFPSHYFSDSSFENFLDLLCKIFIYNPSARITPEQALNHSFFTEVKIGIRENSLRSPHVSKQRSSVSSLDNSPSSKLSTGIDSCCMLSPPRQGSFTVQEESLLGEVPRRTSLQDSYALFSKPSQ